MGMRPSTIAAVERVKAGASPVDAADAEGVSVAGVYAALRREKIDWPGARRPDEVARAHMSLAARTNRAESRAAKMQRELARALVREAGLPLLRDMVDQAISLLNDGYSSGAVSEALQRKRAA